MHFEEWMELVVHIFEAFGVAILAVGSLLALVGAARAVSRGERRTAYEQARQHVGRAILLGLEVLIIADIVEGSPFVRSRLAVRHTSCRPPARRPVRAGQTATCGAESAASMRSPRRARRSRPAALPPSMSLARARLGDLVPRAPRRAAYAPVG